MLLEISLLVIFVVIGLSLQKNKEGGQIIAFSYVLSLVYYVYTTDVFGAGMMFVVSLYVIYLGWSLKTIKPYFKNLSNINVDILLFLGILFAWKYTEAEVIKTTAIFIVGAYIFTTYLLTNIGKNNKKGVAAATYTLKKGYLLHIEEVDKEVSLLIVTLVTIAFSVWGWMTPNLSTPADSITNDPIVFEITNKELGSIIALDQISNVKNLDFTFEDDNKVSYQGLKKPAYKEIFNYQLTVFLLTLLMLIFSYIKFSLKRDELTKKEDKRVILASRGRYGEYYGCNNILIWESRRKSIRRQLGKPSFSFEIDFFKEEIDSFFKDEDSTPSSKGRKDSWDFLCQLASAYYSHAIANNKYGNVELIKHEDLFQYAGYLLRAFNIYEQLPDETNQSDEYYHYVDVCNDLDLLYNYLSSDKDFLQCGSPLKGNKFFLKNINDSAKISLEKLDITIALAEDFDNLLGSEKTKENYTNILNTSINYKFNQELKYLKEKLKEGGIESSLDCISRLEDILSKDISNYKDLSKSDIRQIGAASKHTKTIELLSALKYAHEPDKLEKWINEFKYATGHIGKNISKFQAQRFDAPANLFIRITGSFILMIGIIILLEIFDYSKVGNIEIFALSSSAFGMIFAFIFKSTIESFFASLQMYLSDMLRVGDRIKCSALNIDGYVSGFGFSSIDFQNLDNSHIKLPATDLIKQTFSNLSSLPSTGRRIEIKLTFSANSINRYMSKDIQYVKNNIIDMDSYFECKLDSLMKTNCPNKEIVNIKNIKCYEDTVDSDTIYPQKRFLTNLGSFRSYTEQYLFEHQWLNDSLSPMVVISDTAAEGVTVLITAYSQPDDRFVRTKAFMNLQSDILEHLIITSKYFKLKLHQSESETETVVFEKGVATDLLQEDIIKKTEDEIGKKNIN